jgi:hypothetical protein
MHAVDITKRTMRAVEGLVALLRASATQSREIAPTRRATRGLLDSLGRVCRHRDDRGAKTQHGADDEG